MKQVSTEHTCALCQAELKWWNAQSCLDCGKKICNHHSCTLKRSSHSSVLMCYCVHCSENHLKANAQPATVHNAKTQYVTQIH